MPRRPPRVSRALYASRRSRSTSRADGPGFLYAYIDYGRRWKIGMTRNFVRRKKEWDKQCPSSDRRWMLPMVVPRRRRAESQAHLLLELSCSDRPRIYCPRCRRTHVEVFEFSGNWRFAWSFIVRPLLVRAARALVSRTKIKQKSHKNHQMPIQKIGVLVYVPISLLTKYSRHASRSSFCKPHQCRRTRC
ncbi:hypothetical protein EV361DRAFT_412887 [Lentinula raphanica]|nr:hypothetical protein EV361DRAFT_412887 [Lentinula raphanica]